MHMLKPALIIIAAGAAFASIPAASARSGTAGRRSQPPPSTAAAPTISISPAARATARSSCASPARPLRLRNVRIYYRNGGRQDAGGRQWLNPGSCTLRMDLRGRGRDRDITRVRLTYDPFGRGGRNPVVRISAH